MIAICCDVLPCVLVNTEFAENILTLIGRQDQAVFDRSGLQTLRVSFSPIRLTAPEIQVRVLLTGVSNTVIIRSGITSVSRNVISRRFLQKRKQPSRVGGSPLCDVVSSFLCHTHTGGKDKLLKWPDRSCLLLYVSARIH